MGLWILWSLMVKPVHKDGFHDSGCMLEVPARLAGVPTVHKEGYEKKARAQGTGKGAGKFFCTRLYLPFYVL
ncbi:hypothetical protein GCM10007386_26460 [Pseudoduganella dura]|nr:hypothetical protein GCM10007386_26460 [Pseudoduganella dura]